jgi:hypothetical protein
MVNLQESKVKHNVGQIGVVFLSQLVVNTENHGHAKNNFTQEVADGLADWGLNFALPIICLTSEEDKYQLLTGISIYEAALASGINKIWAILINRRKIDAEKAVQQAILQSQLNDLIIDREDIAEFLDFLNNEKSSLTSGRGIGDKYACKIRANRPYTSQEDMQKKLGSKLPLNWLRSYKEMKLKKLFG